LTGGSLAPSHRLLVLRVESVGSRHRNVAVRRTDRQRIRRETNLTADLPPMGSSADALARVDYLRCDGSIALGLRAGGVGDTSEPVAFDSQPRLRMARMSLWRVSFRVAAQAGSCVSRAPARTEGSDSAEVAVAGLKGCVLRPGRRGRGPSVANHDPATIKARPSAPPVPTCSSRKVSRQRRR